MDRRTFIEALGAMPVAAGLSPAGRRAPVRGSFDASVEVDLGAIGRNLALVKGHARVPVMAVVKANAYGHGLVEVGRALEGEGVHGLMVGKLDEAVVLRGAGVKARLLNFGPFGPADAGDIVGLGLCQTVVSEDARWLDEAAAKSGRKASVDLHIDTGMNRAGVPWEKAFALVLRLAALPRLAFEGVSTTLTEDPEFDREQVRRLAELHRKAAERGIPLGLRHAASSAGLMKGPELRLDMVRPGIMLYGYYANAEDQARDPLGLGPALRLLGRVTYVNELAPGDSASYHRALRAKARMRVATVDIGYSDGYPTTAAGQTAVAIRGKLFDVVAAVTSNHLMVDLAGDPDVAPGDEAVLIDPRRNSGLTADIVAAKAGISDYRLLIGLNPLLPRTFVAKNGRPR